MAIRIVIESPKRIVGGGQGREDQIKKERKKKTPSENVEVE